MIKRRKWEMSKETLEKLLRCLNDDRDRAGEKYEQIRKALTVFYRNNLHVNFRDDLVDRAINRIARRIEGGAAIVFVQSEEEEKTLREDSPGENEDIESPSKNALDDEAVRSGSEPESQEQHTDTEAERSNKKRVLFIKGKEQICFLRAARFIVTECNKPAHQREISLESRMAGSTWEPSYTPREKTKWEQCLEMCRAAISDDDYEFILDYYSGDKSKKGKEGRQQKDLREEMATANRLTKQALKSRAHRIRSRLRPCLEKCAKG